MAGVKPPSDKAGDLTVVGCGIRTGQLTIEALNAIKRADVVFAVVFDDIGLMMILESNSNVVDLRKHYAVAKERGVAYREMAEEVLASVRQGLDVCFVIYGHPLVLVTPSKIAISTAKDEGYKVTVLPGISAEDSLFCDLEIDPAIHGCQLYCADQFVDEARQFDPKSVLTLWQVGIIGESRSMSHGDATYHDRLCNRLEEVYGPDHPVIFYEASRNPFFGPDLWSAPVRELRSTTVRLCCTIVIPPIDCPDLVALPESAQPGTWHSLSCSAFG